MCVSAGYINRRHVRHDMRSCLEVDFAQLQTLGSK